MKANPVRSSLRQFVTIVIVAVLYYVTARIGFSMALPPGNVTALWPPSGLALAAVLLWGWQMGLGVLVGSFFVNWGSMSGGAAIPVAIAIAVGSTLQAWLAAWALKRFVKTLPPDTVSGTLLAIGSTSLTTLLAPLIGVTSLCVAGYAQWGNFGLLSSTWWLGDQIGILIFTPLLIILFNWLNGKKTHEPFLWTLTSLIIGLSLFIFFMIGNLEKQRINENLVRDTAETTRILADSFDRDIQNLVAIQGLYSASQQVTSAEFVTFVDPLLTNSPATAGLGFAPRVTQAERAAYEQSKRTDGLRDFVILEKNVSGQSVVATRRSEYFPILLIEPDIPNSSMVGLDIGSYSTGLETIAQVRDSGNVAVTAPIYTERVKVGEPDILLILPVYQNHQLTNTVEKRRANLQGLTVGVYHVDTLVKEALKNMNRHDIEFFIYDVTNPDKPQFLAFYPSVSGMQALPIGEIPELDSLQTEFTKTVKLNIGGRDWMVVALPTPAYVSTSSEWIAWGGLIIGLMVAGAFLVYVQIRQRTEETLSRSEAEFRALSEHALTGVARYDLVTGRVLYANKSTAQMFGFDVPEALLGASLYPFINDPHEPEELTQTLRSVGEIRDQVIEILTGQDQKRYLLSSASLHENLVSLTLMDVTDRILAEQEIMQLSRVVSQMADTVVITDINGVIEYVNPAFEKLTGYASIEAIGKTPRVLKSGFHTLEFYQNLWSVVLRGEVFQADIVNRKKTGEIYHETKTIAPIRNADGKITHFVATGKDITERKQVEAALLESEERFRAVFESNNAIMLMIEPDSGDIVDANPAAADFYGYSRKQLTSMNIAVLNQLPADEVARERQNAKEEKRNYFIFPHKLASGQIRTVEVRSHPIHTKDRVLLFSIIYDVTERKLVEEALNESKLMFHLLIESLPQNIYAKDIEGRFIFANQHYCVTEGRSLDEIVGRTDLELHPQELAEKYRRDDCEVIQTGKTFELEEEHSTADGKKTVVQVIKAPFYDSKGRTAGTLGIFWDITERKQNAVLQDTVYRIAEAAQTSESLQDLYTQIHSQISNVMYAENFYIALYDEVNHLINFVYFVDQAEPSAGGSFAPGNGLTEYVMRTGKSLLCDRHKEAELIALGECARVGADSQIWLGAPLIAHGKTIGAMAVQHYSNAAVYTERDQRILEFVSSQVATAIDRKQAEETVRRIERRNQSIIEYAPDGILLQDINGKILYSSPSANHILGFDYGELLGQVSFQWVHADDKPVVVAAKTDILRDPLKIRTVQFRFENKHGNMLWLESTYSNLLAEPGLNAIVVNFRDITESKRANELLQKSRASLETAQTIAHLGSWELEPSTGLGLSWSKEMFQLFHRDPAQGVPPLDEFLECVHVEDRQALLNAQQYAIETNQPVAIEYRTNFKDGKTYYFKATIQSVKDAQGQLTYMSGTVLDITEIKRAQLELEVLNRDLEQRVEERTAEVRQSEETYRALFESANDAIFLIHPHNGKIVRVNARCAELLGYSTQELIGKDSSAFTAATELDDAEHLTEQLLAGKRIPVYERQLIRKDGVQINTEVNLSLITQGDGQPKLIQSVVRDITERKKAQEALRESRDQLSIANAALEKASRLKDEFLASMSHELRTPLTGILGLSEALQLQTYGALTEKQNKSVATIESSGRHLLELINDILDLSKIEAGKLDMQIEACSLTDICQASMQLVKGMAHQKHINVSYEISPAMINIRADARRIKQMLVNLLSNAIKFTPDNGEVGLDVQGNEEMRVVQLRVWDKGIGIKAEEMSKLFKPFTQLDSSLARQYSGTGLGLSLVQRMAELHGGSITVESTPGVGSTFTIALPWLSQETTQPISTLKRKNPDPSKSMMIVEDNDLDAELATRYLQQLGLVSVVQPVMQGALEKAVALKPGVILLDLHLTDGYGLDLLKQLKADQRTQNIPVIITSVEEQQAEALKLGAVGYLLKPFRQEDLQTELSKAAAYGAPPNPVMLIGAREIAPLVMIADDNEMIVDMVGDFLESKGYRIATARSGYELLERVCEIHPDIMLVDIQMPGMNGLESISRLRASGDPVAASAPIIAVTALAMSGDREKCLLAGANEYISKPVILTQLHEHIQKLLKARIAQRV